MKIRPASITFNSHTQADNFRAFARIFFDLVAEAKLPPVRRWQVGDDPTNRGVEELTGVIEALPADDARAPRHLPALFFELADGTLGSVRFHSNQGSAEFCSAHLQRLLADEDTMDDMLAFQRQCLYVSLELLRRVGLHSVDLTAQGNGVRCIPEVPLVTEASHVVATNRGETDELYDQPDAFWKGGWTVVEEHDSQSLLARDMDVVCGPEYLARIIDHQWSMARAAKPRETVYSWPVVLPEEEPIFKAGSARLYSVGYSADEKSVEYSCALNAGEHIRGWEIYALLNILEEHRLSDGSPVETVRVVFMEQWAAQQEKRPLLDIGCRVFHYDDDGELKEVTE